MGPISPKRSIAGASRFSAALVAAASVTLALTATAAPASADTSVLARTVYYSASAYSNEADQAAQIWSSRAPNVRMVRGGNATIRIYGTTGGGSRAYPCGLGCATIYIDSRDVAAGHSSLRIVAHEIGHGLGLPDNYNGVCSYLMSGGSAGPSCRNPNPNAQEAARVNSLFARRGAATGAVGSDVYDTANR